MALFASIVGLWWSVYDLIFDDVSKKVSKRYSDAIMLFNSQKISEKKIFSKTIVFFGKLLLIFLARLFTLGIVIAFGFFSGGISKIISIIYVSFLLTNFIVKGHQDHKRKYNFSDNNEVIRYKKESVKRDFISVFSDILDIGYFAFMFYIIL